MILFALIAFSAAFCLFLSFGSFLYPSIALAALSIVSLSPELATIFVIFVMLFTLFVMLVTFFVILVTFSTTLSKPFVTFFKSPTVATLPISTFSKTFCIASFFFVAFSAAVLPLSLSMSANVLAKLPFGSTALVMPVILPSAIVILLAPSPTVILFLAVTLSTSISFASLIFNSPSFATTPIFGLSLSFLSSV